MRQNRVHLMPPMSNFYARICVKATPSSNSRPNTEAKAASVARFKDAALHIFAVFLKHNQQHHRENLPRLRC